MEAEQRTRLPFRIRCPSVRRAGFRAAIEPLCRLAALKEADEVRRLVVDAGARQADAADRLADEADRLMAGVVAAADRLANSLWSRCSRIPNPSR